MHRRFVTCLLCPFSITALLECPAVALAQDTTTITGIVIDGTTEAPLNNVRVSNVQETVVTGPDGRFSITLTDAETTLRFEADGYLEATLPAEGTNLEVLLFRYTFAETVNVESDAVDLERPSTNPLTSEEVLRVAGSIDNIFRALDTLPGVAATDDFTSRLAVRGGTPDQNLTVMDVEWDHKLKSSWMHRQVSPWLCESGATIRTPGCTVAALFFIPVQQRQRKI